MGDAEPRSCKNQNDLIAKAILDNFSKYVQKPAAVTNERNCCVLRGNKSPLVTSTSCFSDWSPRQSKCFTGNNSLPSRTSATGYCGDPCTTSTSNFSSLSRFGARKTSIFRGLRSDESRFSVSGSRGSAFCCPTMSRGTRGLGGGGGIGLGCGTDDPCKTDSDDCCFTPEQDDGCNDNNDNIGCKSDSCEFGFNIDSDKRAFAPLRGFGVGTQSSSTGYEPQQPQQQMCCINQMGNNASSTLDSCLRVVRDSPPQRREVDCCGMNGGDSFSSSQRFSMSNGGDSSRFYTDSSSFRTLGGGGGGGNGCSDPCAVNQDPCQEDPCGFGGGSSMRSNNGSAFSSYGAGMTSQFGGSDMCRPKARTTDCCQQNDCGQNNQDDLCCSLDSMGGNGGGGWGGSQMTSSFGLSSVGQTNGGSQFTSIFGSVGQTNGGSQFVQSAFRPNSAFTAFPSAMSGSNRSNGLYDSCTESRDPCDFSAPVKPRDPCDFSEPVKPRDPCDFSAPVKPRDPCDFSAPVKPRDPCDFSAPVKPRDPCDFSEPVKPRDPCDFSAPVKPRDPCDFSAPVQSCDPCDIFKSPANSQNYSTDMFRSNGDNSCYSDPCARMAKTSNFASNSCRPNGECGSDICSDPCGFPSSSFRPSGEGFTLGSYGPPDNKSKGFLSNSCNDECNDFCTEPSRPADPCDFGSNSFRSNNQGSPPFMSGSFRPAGNDFSSNSCNDQCNDLCGEPPRPADPCDFGSNSYGPNNQGPQFMGVSFRPAGNDFSSNACGQNDDCNDFCGQPTRPADPCDFGSNSFGSNNQGPQFMADSFRPGGNSFRPNEGSCGASCGDRNSGSMDCCAPNDCCDFKDDCCLASMCGMGLDEWFAVSPSLQAVVAKLASKSVKKGGDEILKDLSRLKAANILPPDFKIPGEEQHDASQCGGGQGAEASPSQLKLTAERLVEHIVCRAAKIEAAQDENVDLSECDVFLEDVVKKISSIICKATEQQQKQQQQQQQQQQKPGDCSAPASQAVSKASSKASSPSNSEASVVSGNSSANNSAVKSRRQLHDCICDTLMQNCFALLGVDPATFEDISDVTGDGGHHGKDPFDLRYAAKMLWASGLTWNNFNNSQGGADDGSTSTSTGNSSVSNASLSNSILSATVVSTSILSHASQASSAVSGSAAPNSAGSFSTVSKSGGSNSTGSKSGAPNSAGTISTASKSGASNSAGSKSVLSKSGVSNSPDSKSVLSKSGASNSPDSKSVLSKSGASNSPDSKSGAPNSAGFMSAASKPGASSSAGSKSGAPNSAGSIAAVSKPGASSSAGSKSGAPNSAGSTSAVPNSGASSSAGSKSGASSAAGSKSGASIAAGSKSGASSAAGSKSGASNSAGSKSGASNSAGSTTSAGPISTAPVSANASSVGKAKSLESVSNKEKESRLSDVPSSGHEAETKAEQRSRLSLVVDQHEKRTTFVHHSTGSIGILQSVSSSALPPTTFLELRPPEPTVPEHPTGRRDSMDAAILRMLEATLEDCTKLADNAELRWFVMEVVYSLYATVRQKLETILKQQVDDAAAAGSPMKEPLEDLLSNADKEIREIVLPAVIEHIVWVLRQDAKQRGGKVKKEAAKALAGEYVDTIVTNAVLKLETNGKMRRPYAKMFVVTSNDPRYKRPFPMPRVANEHVATKPSPVHSAIRPQSKKPKEMSPPSVKSTDISVVSSTSNGPPSTASAPGSSASATHNPATPASTTNSVLSQASAASAPASQASSKSATHSQASLASVPDSQASSKSAAVSQSSSTSTPRRGQVIPRI